ncbi:MAG TPA: hypothetical protein VMV53_01520 [Acidimicrobiales bacterium]|nr:hypothetical protein [Acidimicrobiales bacterium]
MEGADKVQSESPSATTVGRLTGGAAIRAHLTLAVGLVLCALAFWIELRRAEGGNSLSWAYVFEWPLLAVFAVYMWWKILHSETADHVRSKKKEPALAPEYSGMLQAWQEHQRELAAQREQESSPALTHEEEEWS